MCPLADRPSVAIVHGLKAKLKGCTLQLGAASLQVVLREVVVVAVVVEVVEVVDLGRFQYKAVVGVVVEVAPFQHKAVVDVALDGKQTTGLPRDGGAFAAEAVAAAGAAAARRMRCSAALLRRAGLLRKMVWLCACRVTPKCQL